MSIRGEQIRRGGGSHPRQEMTYEDYMRLPETMLRCELIGGFVVREPAPIYIHQAVVGNLYRLLYDEACRTGGMVLLSPFDTVLSREDRYVVQPDLIYLAPESLSALTPKNLQGAPDLAVEIVSPTSRRKDLVLRRNIYAHFGIREYWIVDPQERVIEVLALWPGGGEPLGRFRPGEPIRSRVLPAFHADPAAVFADAPGDAGTAQTSDISP